MSETTIVEHNEKEKRRRDDDSTTEDGPEETAKRRELELSTQNALTNAHPEKSSKADLIKEENVATDGASPTLQDKKNDLPAEPLDTTNATDTPRTLTSSFNTSTLPSSFAASKGFGGFSSSSAFASTGTAGGFSSLLSSKQSDSGGFSSLLDAAPTSSIFGAETASGDATKSVEEEGVVKEAEYEAEAADEDQYVVVKGLERTSVPTGEEEENCIHSVRAKLYALDSKGTTAGWKERGVGNLRMLQDKGNRTRLVMRADAVLRVILNLPLHPQYKLENGGDSMGEKTLRLFGVEDGQGIWLALRVSSEKLAQQLKLAIQRAMDDTPVTDESHRKSLEAAPRMEEKEKKNAIEGVVPHHNGVVPHKEDDQPEESNTLDSVETTELANAKEIEHEKSVSEVEVPISNKHVD